MPTDYWPHLPSYKPDEGHDCVMHGKSPRLEPCWGNVTEVLEGDVDDPEFVAHLEDMSIDEGEAQMDYRCSGHALDTETGKYQLTYMAVDRVIAMRVGIYDLEAKGGVIEQDGKVTFAEDADAD